MNPPAEIYLDHNATTPPLPEVVTAVTEAMVNAYGNASSGHRRGDPARRLLHDAREVLRQCLSAPEDSFVFTGSGSEANNLAINSLASHCEYVIVSAVEHSSVLGSAKSLRGDKSAPIVIGVDADGRLDLAELEEVLRSYPRAGLSIQWANNETGVLQPLYEIIDLARKHGAMIHIDASQAVGKVEAISWVDADYLTLTAHKFNGPAGVGALYARRPDLVAPLCFGGKQQGGLHAGTENIAGIKGLCRALELRYADLSGCIDYMASLRDKFEDMILDLCPWVKVNGIATDRICNTSNLRFEGIDGQALIGRLDSVGIYCSQSSACTSGSPEPSYVLRAMGLSESQAYASIRFSFGITNTLSEVETAAAQVAAEAEYLRRIFA